MTTLKNMPLLMNLAYAGYNRGLDGDFKPAAGKTFCNKFIQYVLSGFGYDKTNGMVANDMIAFMEDYRNGWITQDDQTAQARANEGVIVVAGHRHEDHGHVCLIVPGILEQSGGYGKAVPRAANVGKDVFFGKKVSFAFSALEQPKYYALAGMI